MGLYTGKIYERDPGDDGAPMVHVGDYTVGAETQAEAVTAVKAIATDMLRTVSYAFCDPQNDRVAVAFVEP